MLQSIYIILSITIIYLLYGMGVYIINKRPAEVNDIGCYRVGCGQICGNEQETAGMHPLICSPGDECYIKFGECIRYGSRCNWKPTLELAECLAKAGEDGVANNPLRFSRADCNVIIDSCEKLSEYCIKE